MIVWMRKDKSKPVFYLCERQRVLAILHPLSDLNMASPLSWATGLSRKGGTSCKTSRALALSHSLSLAIFKWAIIFLTRPRPQKPSVYQSMCELPNYRCQTATRPTMSQSTWVQLIFADQCQSLHLKTLPLLGVNVLCTLKYVLHRTVMQKWWLEYTIQWFNRQGYFYKSTDVKTTSIWTCETLGVPRCC